MMKTVVGIGANVYDTLITLKKYPEEDTKSRCEEIRQSGGGPVATGLVAAAKLGAECAPGYASFSSCIWLSSERATRTVVFDRGNLPPTAIGERESRAIADASLLMVDGNDLDAAVAAAKIARGAKTKVLYDAGGLYEGVERLLPYADYLIPSEEFALGHTGAKTADEAVKILYDRYSPAFVVVTQGKRGGILYDGKTVTPYPALPASVVDSNGAGDVFHGAFAYAMTMGYDPARACVFASATSALKCEKLGARDGAPDIAAVKTFLKENGYEF